MENGSDEHEDTDNGAGEHEEDVEPQEHTHSLEFGTKAVALSSNKPLTSKFRGVCWNKKNKRWQAAINSSGKYLYLGSYDTEQEAARIFDKAAVRIRGAKARLNFRMKEYLDEDGAVLKDVQIEALLLEACNPAKPRRQRARSKAQKDQEAAAAEAAVLSGALSEGGPQCRQPEAYPPAINARPPRRAAANAAAAAVAAVAAAEGAMNGSSLDDSLPFPAMPAQAPRARAAAPNGTSLPEDLLRGVGGQGSSMGNSAGMNSGELYHGQSARPVRKSVTSCNFSCARPEGPTAVSGRFVPPLPGSGGGRFPGTLAPPLSLEGRSGVAPVGNGRFILPHPLPSAPLPLLDGCSGPGRFHAALPSHHMSSHVPPLRGAVTALGAHRRGGSGGGSYELEYGGSSYPQLPQLPITQLQLNGALHRPGPPLVGYKRGSSPPPIRTHLGMARGPAGSSGGSAGDSTMSRVMRSLPPGVHLDSIIPSPGSDSVLGVLYRLPNTCLTSAAVWSASAPGSGLRPLGQYESEKDAKQACTSMLKYFQDMEGEPARRPEKRQALGLGPGSRPLPSLPSLSPRLAGGSSCMGSLPMLPSPRGQGFTAGDQYRGGGTAGDRFESRGGAEPYGGGSGDPYGGDLGGGNHHSVPSYGGPSQYLEGQQYNGGRQYNGVLPLGYSRSGGGGGNGASVVRGPLHGLPAISAAGETFDLGAFGSGGGVMPGSGGRDPLLWPPAHHSTQPDPSIHDGSLASGCGAPEQEVTDESPIDRHRRSISGGVEDGFGGTSGPTNGLKMNGSGEYGNGGAGGGSGAYRLTMAGGSGSYVDGHRSSSGGGGPAGSGSSGPVKTAQFAALQELSAINVQEALQLYHAHNKTEPVA